MNIMYTIIETDQFTKWLNSIKDRTTRMRLTLRELQNEQS